ncbi:Membrane metallo-endopeptidase-like 1 [Armadillidium nasatum]|uniref:Membrane metallo-endopeptidase-like 1 n=1 Tax=Armadillidium nasatum TaxID=96803 RepID=A0A5N5SUC7_9CRUS|nr:Membrane metallo-endopeptidase-like 1 [Armadillidium nasatum]
MLLCWKGRTKRERYLMLTLTTVLFVACLLAFSLASLLTGRSQIHEDQPLAQAQTQTLVEPPCVVNQQNPPSSSSISSDVPTDVCLTQGCVKAAASIMERLNETADPCEDFFDFACGNFVKNTVIPEEKTSVTTFSIVQDELRQKMRILLEEKIKDSDPPATIMAKNLYSSCMDTDRVSLLVKKNIEETAHRNGSLVGFEDAEDFVLAVGFVLLFLDQPALGMSREYLIKGNNDSDVKAYLKYSVDVAVLLGAPKERAEKEMFDVLQLQMDIANVDENERIGVSDPNYFRNLKKLLDKTPKRVVANYLLWRVTAAAASYLSEDIRKLQLEYSKKLTGKSVNPPRWKECMGIVSSKLSYAIGNLYSKNFFNEKAKAQAVELVTYVREEFNRILKSIDWMDEKTRKQALQKADAIRPHIAYPQELLQDEKLTEYYRNLTVDNKTLLDNMRRIGIFGTSYSFSKLREMVDKLDWKRHASVAVVNAYYSSIENSIIGNLKNWWERETEERFLAKAKCIIYQYGNYTAPENGLSLNGINTQGENIADNGGIKEAYKAYHKWAEVNGKEKRLPGLKYTTDQLFWISAGQVWCSKYRPESLKVRILTGVHSPGRFRVVGSFSNSEEFSTAWNCPVGSKMNPQKKCSVWGGKTTQRIPDVQKKGITEPSINKEETEQPIDNEEAETPINNEEAEAPINNEEVEPPINKEEEAEPPINNEETEPPINNEEEAEPPINNEETEPPINNEEEAEPPINNEEAEPSINNEKEEIENGKEEIEDDKKLLINKSL